MINKIQPVLILLLLYFLLPKFDLFLVPGSVTGIRIQDIICLSLFLILFEYKINSKILLILILFSTHLLYSLIIWNSFTSIYGFFRLIEYFFVAKGIIFIVEKGYWKFYFNSIIVYLLIFSVLQYLYLLPNIDPGRGVHYSSQFSGPFGTPAELTYFMIAFLFLNYQINQLNIFKFISCSFVLFNGVKAGIAGFVILSFQYLRRPNIFMIILLFLISIPLASLSYEYFLSLKEFILAIFQHNNMENSISEQSLGLRINKWIYVASQLYQHPLALFLGFGVYSYTGALDGGVLKFLFEFGLIGLLYMIYILQRLSKMFFLIVLSTNILFDAYASSVVMPVLIATYLIISEKKAT